jgi:homospermidine synthase
MSINKDVLKAEKFRNMGDRMQKLQKLYNSFDFGKDRTLVIIGFGSMGTTNLYMILKLFKIRQNQIIVIDKMDPSEFKVKVKEVVRAARPDEDFDIELISDIITQENYVKYFNKLKKDDVIVDCSIEINTLDMLKLCQKIGLNFVNSAIETWSYMDIDDPETYTIYFGLNGLRDYEKELKKKGEKINFNLVAGMGCNPGMVSIWAQVAIDKINEYYGNKVKKNAKELGVRTVHISEYDTQKVNIPKKQNEYCNTWGSTAEPFYEESLAPVEMTFGSHEDKPTKNIAYYDPKQNYLILDQLCMETQAQSYTPGYGNYLGYLIRHEENITIGETLSTYKNEIDGSGNKVKDWSPSVYYVYHPSASTMESLYELRERNYEYQENIRLMTHEITEGADELGLTFFLENGDVFWIGSLLDIDEARELFENKLNHRMNATVVQVAGGYLSGIMRVIELSNEGKKQGVLVPDDMPYKHIYKTMEPFYGEFIFMNVKDKWNPSFRNRSFTFNKFKKNYVNKKLEWKLQDFLINPENVIGLSKNEKQLEEVPESNVHVIESKKNAAIKHTQQRLKKEAKKNKKSSRKNSKGKKSSKRKTVYSLKK